MSIFDLLQSHNLKNMIFVESKSKSNGAKMHFFFGFILLSSAAYSFWAKSQCRRCLINKRHITIYGLDEVTRLRNALTVGEEIKPKHTYSALI